MFLKLQAARNELVALATTDALTDLLNRRSVLLRLEEEMERHRRDRKPLGTILLDVDHFKQVNDRFGHAAGDEVLRQVARGLRETVRPYDAVGRFGGEEFLVVLPGTDPVTLHGVAERLRTRLQEQVRTGPPEAVQAVTASLGIATWRPEEGADAFLARADRGMYRAKAQGRNRVEEDPA
jgi:diguanylate cyclase (GGDEF)-like protein